MKFLFVVMLRWNFFVVLHSLFWLHCKCNSHRTKISEQQTLTLMQMMAFPRFHTVILNTIPDYSVYHIFFFSTLKNSLKLRSSVAMNLLDHFFQFNMFKIEKCWIFTARLESRQVSAMSQFYIFSPQSLRKPQHSSVQFFLSITMGIGILTDKSQAIFVELIEKKIRKN